VSVKARAWSSRRPRLWIADDRGQPVVDGCSRVGLVGDAGEVSPDLPRPGGVFSRAEALRHGYDDAGIRRELRTGRWVRLRHGIYAPGELARAAAEDPRVAHALALAAELGARAGPAVGSHESAAWLHELSTLAPRPTTASLTVVRHMGRYRVGGVRLRMAALPPHHVACVLGVPVTSAARTVVDLARERPFVEAVVVADSALRLGAADRAGLRGVLADCQRWPGTRPAIGVGRRDLAVSHLHLQLTRETEHNGRDHGKFEG
jgi:Transcriptional regulator, AbiEi antitoxin